VFYQRQNLLTLREHLRSARLFGGVRVVHHFSFCVVLLCFFTFLDPCCEFRYNFRIKTMFVPFYLQLFVGVLMSYLRYFCIFFVHSGVQHIWLTSEFGIEASSVNEARSHSTMPTFGNYEWLQTAHLSGRAHLNHPCKTHCADL